MQKRLYAGILAVILGFSVSLLWNSGGDVKNVERLVAESTLYTGKDIEKAMDIAIKAFSEGFDGCKLLSVSYDEAETLAEMQRQRGRKESVKLLVLVSDFYAGKNAEACFNPDTVYRDWKWILRDDGNGWKMVNWGYA